jgi:hypothetical protein
LPGGSVGATISLERVDSRQNRAFKKARKQVLSLLTGYRIALRDLADASVALYEQGALRLDRGGDEQQAPVTGLHDIRIFTKASLLPHGPCRRQVSPQTRNRSKLAEPGVPSFQTV